MERAKITLFSSISRGIYIFILISLLYAIVV